MYENTLAEISLGTQIFSFFLTTFHIVFKNKQYFILKLRYREFRIRKEIGRVHLGMANWANFFPDSKNFLSGL